MNSLYGLLNEATDLVPGNPEDRFVALIVGDLLLVATVITNTVMNRMGIGGVKSAVESAPTANGWTARQEGTLNEIKDMITQSRREQRADLTEVRETLNQHILDHARESIAGGKNSGG